MFRILEKKQLNPEVVLLRVFAPMTAKKAKPGQFIIFRIDKFGERVPLTIADCDSTTGSVTIVFQTVGKSTRGLANMNVGDKITDFVGPLGTASHLDGYKNACVIGGGLGTAIALPQAKYMHENGTVVDIIAGFRNNDAIILEDEMKNSCENFYITTDDGSNGTKGFVTDVLKKQLDSGKNYDIIIAIGPLVMMRAVCNLTKEYGIKTIVSLNPIMLDGTGMCGACRVTVGGETKFACIDGPDFDGHLVDFDEAISRSTMFTDIEKEEDNHYCKLIGGIRGE